MRGLALLLTSLSIFFLHFDLNAQDKAQTAFDDTRLFYRTELYGGLILHETGFGAMFRKGYRKTGFSKTLLSAELVTMKHPKEIKSFNPYVDDNNKSFIFGKLNSLTVLRPTIGRQKIMYSKIAKKGVEVSYMYHAGLSLGFVKPVYLEIAESISPNAQTINVEKYDSEEHSIEQIIGRASFTRGLDEIRIYPGLHTKFALNFEYAPMDDLLRAIEVGTAVDLYAKEVPIMAFTDNSQFFLKFYLSLQFGKKSI